MINDTIAAISTPAGAGGIGIVRISGDGAFDVIAKVFKPIKPYDKDKIKSFSIKYGHIIDFRTEEIIDEVLVSFFKAPNTYTKENLAEINCHGGMLVTRRVLEIVIQCGARTAEPGEFTKRAFLNGRIDLLQAEAVIEIINSKTNAARRFSMGQLEGRISGKIKSVREKLVGVIADIEAAIDYPEYDIEEISRPAIKESTEWCRKETKALIKTFEEGRIIREGIEAAIIGKPNVGKSSLLNALAQKEKAIITEIPGTTRDIIEEFIEVGGIAVKILDTAGLRDTDDFIEKIGIDRTKSAIEKADLIMLVLDGSEELKEEDREIFNLIKEKKAIILINKTDLETKLDYNEVQNIFKGKSIIEISAKEEIGLDIIENSIWEMFLHNELECSSEAVLTNIRHKQRLEEAAEEMESALDSLESGLPVDIISVSLTEAASKLGEITGETVGDEVLKTIFSKFCIGK